MQAIRSVGLLGAFIIAATLLSTPQLRTMVQAQSPDGLRHDTAAPSMGPYPPGRYYNAANHNSALSGRQNQFLAHNPNGVAPIKPVPMSQMPIVAYWPNFPVMMMGQGMPIGNYPQNLPNTMDGVFPAMPDDTNSIADEAEEKDDEEDEGEQGQEDNSTEESSDQPVTINLDPNTIQAVADAVLKGFQSNDGSGRPYPVPTTARPKDHQPDAFTQIADALRNAVVGDHSK